MADTIVNPNLTPQIWDDRFFTEYLSENRFSDVMGTDELSIIQVKEDLTKKAGDRVNFAFVGALEQDAVTGSNTMEGNEEALDTRSFPITVNKRRNAVRVAEIDEQFSAISLRDAGRGALKEWSMKDTETLIINALASINGVTYGSATEVQKDAWLVDNADRVLFGIARSNNSSNDHSASLANLDTTNDKLTPAAISLMKNIALSVADPKIGPIRSAKSGRRYFVMYAHPYAFNDLKTNSTITQAQREVSIQMENERLFEGGDILWDGVIVKQIDDMTNDLTLLNVGSGGTTTVVPAFLVGRQAMGMAWARRWRTRTEEFDYGDKYGVEISAIYGIGKMTRGSGSADRDDLKDTGVVTGYFATSGF